MGFGEFVKQLRAQKRMGLREFCLKFGHDPSNWSKMERGALPPPKDEDLLEEMASQLGLKKGDKNWFTFLDLAAVAQGSIPADILSNERLAAKLPIFFRTPRGQRPTTQELKRVAELLRKEM